MKNGPHTITARRNRSNLQIIPLKFERVLGVLEPGSDSALAKHMEKELMSVSYWHLCMAHQNLQYIRELLGHFGISYNNNFEKYYASCAKGKIIRVPFQRSFNIVK